MTRPRFAQAPVRVFMAQRITMMFALTCFATYANVRRATELEFNPFELVLVGTVLQLSAFLGEVPTGVFADVFGRRRAILVGFAAIGLGFGLEAFSRELPGVLAAQVIWGTGWTFISGARVAWLADEIGEVRAAPVYLHATQWGQLGALVGIGCAALLAIHSVVLPLQVAAVSVLLLAAGLALCMTETGFSPPEPDERTSFATFYDTLRAGARAARTHRVVALVILAEIFISACQEGFERLWQLRLLRLAAFELPALGPLPGITAFGVIEAVALLLTIPVLAWARRAAQPAQLRKLPVLLVALQGLAFVAAVLFALGATLEVAVAGWWTWLILSRTINPLETAWCNQRLDSRVRATVLSLLNQGSSLGALSGGLMIGALGLITSLPVGLVCAAGLLLPAVALFGYAALRSRAS